MNENTAYKMTTRSGRITKLEGTVPLRHAMERHGLRYADLPDLIAEVNAGCPITADDWTRFELDDPRTAMHMTWCTAYVSSWQNLRDAGGDLEPDIIQAEAQGYVRDGYSTCTCGASRVDLHPTALALVQLAGICWALDHGDPTVAEEGSQAMDDWVAVNFGTVGRWDPIYRGPVLAGIRHTAVGGDFAELVVR